MLLFNHFLAEAALTHGLGLPTVTPDAAQLLVAHPWPGNVRELRNVTERLVLHEHAGEITPDDLPGAILGIPMEGTHRAETTSGPTAARIASDPLATMSSARGDELWERLMAGHDVASCPDMISSAWSIAGSAKRGAVTARCSDYCGSTRPTTSAFMPFCIKPDVIFPSARIEAPR